MKKWMAVGMLAVMMTFSAGCNLSPEANDRNATASWAYEFVVWDGQTYEILNEEVGKDRLDQELGTIKRSVAGMDANKEGESYTKQDGDSNRLPVGAKVYQLKGTDKAEAIAVEENGVYKKAVLADK